MLDESGFGAATTMGGLTRDKDREVLGGKPWYRG